VRQAEVGDEESTLARGGAHGRDRAHVDDVGHQAESSLGRQRGRAAQIGLLGNQVSCAISSTSARIERARRDRSYPRSSAPNRGRLEVVRVVVDRSLLAQQEQGRAAEGLSATTDRSLCPSRRSALRTVRRTGCLHNPWHAPRPRRRYRNARFAPREEDTLRNSIAGSATSAGSGSAPSSGRKATSTLPSSAKRG